MSTRSPFPVLRRTLAGVLVVLGVCAVPAHAQKGTITGTVEEADSGEPLPAVNVGIVDTPLGAATDEQGRFTILDVPVGHLYREGEPRGFRTVERFVPVTGILAILIAGGGLWL